LQGIFLRLLARSSQCECFICSYDVERFTKPSLLLVTPEPLSLFSTVERHNHDVFTLLDMVYWSVCCLSLILPACQMAQLHFQVAGHFSRVIVQLYTC